jgi:zinc/manganese transport system substrate-binding protein
MKRLILAFFLLINGTAPAWADLNVVATLPWIGSVLREIGGDKVRMTVLVKPSQDPHMIEAKPGMILAARKADAIFFNGLDLEIGYLPLLIDSARNPKLQPGKPGYFDCSQFVEPIEKPESVDRRQGDVHPLGNPHYHFSVSTVLKIAEGMATALGQLDPENAAAYQSNYAAFLAKAKVQQENWDALPLKGKRFLAHHRLYEYLAKEYGFAIVNYIEPKPGIPPSVGHIEDLLKFSEQAKPDGILVSPYSPKNEAKFISAKSGVSVILVPHDVGSVPGAEDYLGFVQTAVEVLK